MRVSQQHEGEIPESWFEINWWKKPSPFTETGNWDLPGDESYSLRKLVRNEKECAAPQYVSPYERDETMEDENENDA